MLEQVVRLTVSVTVHEGQIDEFLRVAGAMTTGSNAEPGTLGYEWFVRHERQFRLLETYVDAKAVEAHFTGPVVQELVPQLIAHCTVNAVEFYGNPGPRVIEMAAGLGAVFYNYRFGIGR